MRLNFKYFYIEQRHGRFIQSALKKEMLANRDLENHQIYQSPYFKGAIGQRSLNHIRKTFLLKLQSCDIAYISDLLGYNNKGPGSLTELIGTEANDLRLFKEGYKWIGGMERIRVGHGRLNNR